MKHVNLYDACIVYGFASIQLCSNMCSFVVQPYWASYICVLPAQENSRGSGRAANVFTAGRARARIEGASQCFSVTCTGGGTPINGAHPCHVSPAQATHLVARIVSWPCFWSGAV